MSLTKAIEHGKEPIMTDYSTIHGCPMRYERGGVTVEIDGTRHWFSMLWQALDFVSEREDGNDD
jgi:hypothetical protein